MQPAPTMQRRNLGRGLLLSGVATAAMLSGAAAAAPTGGETVAGQASILTSGTRTAITQSSERAIIDWRSFSTAAGESVAIEQPGSSSVLLNRVRGGEASSLLGSLTANGRVMLVNPSGVLIGASGSIDAGSFLVTTSDIRNDDFMAGRYNFQRTPTAAGAAIRNQGVIRVGEDGFAVLSAAMVQNSGVVEARLGTVVFGGTESFVLDLAGDGLLTYQIGPTAGTVENAGRILAAGGQVLMTARGASDAMASAINSTGIVEATSIANRNGRIFVEAEGGDVALSGRLDVSSATGRGGAIDITGDLVTLQSATLDASGLQGGGRVRVGGGARGGSELAHAQEVSIDADSRLTVDATGHGDGGQIVLWSDASTRSFAPLSVRGGPEGGNGGFIETSGKNELIVRGKMSLEAPRGVAGTWLIDPAFVTIQDGADTGDYTQATVTVGTLEAVSGGTVSISATSGITIANLGGDQTINMQIATTLSLDTVNGDITFTDSNDSIDTSGIGGILLSASFANQNGSLVNIGNLSTQSGPGIQLSAGTNVTIAGTLSASSAAIGIDAVTGNVTLNGSVSAANGINISAGKNIDVSNAPLITSNALIGLQARQNASNGTADPAIGEVRISNSNVTTNGGDVIIGGGTNPVLGYARGGTAGSVTGGFGVLVVNSTVDAGGGNVFINGQGADNVTAANGIEIGSNGVLTTSGAGIIDLAGVGASGTSFSSGINFYDGGSVFNTGTGAILIDGTSSAAGTSPFGVSFDKHIATATRVYSTGSGPITISARGAGALLTAVTPNGSSQGTIGSDGTTTYNSQIVLEADRMALGTLSIQTTGAGNVSVRNVTLGQLIDLGSTSDASASTLALSQAELSRFTTQVLNIGQNGGAASGQLNISLPVSVQTGGGLTLTGTGITQSAGAVLTAGLVSFNSSAGVNMTLNNVFNSVGPSTSSGGAFQLRRAGGPLTIGGAVTAGANPIMIATSGGNLTIGATGVLTNTGSNDIVLSTNQNFFNSNGGTALQPGRKFLVYSTRPDQDNKNGLTGTNYYGATTTSNPAASYTDSTSRFLYSYQPTLTITANSSARLYGGTDSLTFNATGLMGGDTVGTAVTGALTRDAGENVGTYTIRKGSLTSPQNYLINFNTGTLTINKATLTVTPDAKFKSVGNNDPELTYSVSGLLLGDSASVVSGAMSRAAGETPGSYTINLGSLAAQNYALNLAAGTLTINFGQVTVTFTPKSKVYGDTDPEPQYTVTGLGPNSSLTGRVDRIAGENVGSYTYSLGTLSAGAGYNYTVNSAALTITQAPLTITPKVLSKLVGAADPALTFTATGLKRGDTIDVLTGELVRATGETAGKYDINMGTLKDPLGNYKLTLTPTQFQISRGTLLVTARPLTKSYGSDDPELTYTVTGPSTVSDPQSQVSGKLARSTGEDVGSYSITIGSLSAGDAFELKFTGSTLTITPAQLTVTPRSVSKVYGDADPTLTFDVSGLRRSDTASIVTGALARATGSNVGSYAINIGSLAAGKNYTLSLGGGAQLTITPAALTVQAASATKQYGDSDPTLQITATGFKNGDTQATALSGSPSRASGENVGSYAITQGSLAAVGGNYTLTFRNGSSLTITQRPLTITALDQTRVERQANPTFTLTYSGFVNGDTSAVVTGVQASSPADGTSLAGAYPINLSSGSATNYALSLVGGTLTVTPAPPPPPPPPPPASTETPALPAAVAGVAPVSVITSAPSSSSASSGNASSSGSGATGSTATSPPTASSPAAVAAVVAPPPPPPPPPAPPPPAPTPAGTPSVTPETPQAVALAPEDSVQSAGSGSVVEDAPASPAAIPGLLGAAPPPVQAPLVGAPGISQNFPTLGPT